MLYAQVIVKQRTNVHELTYALSAQIVPYVKVGSLVRVPIRRSQVLGVVVGFSRRVPHGFKGNIREIIKLEARKEIFSSAQIEVIEHLADYYGAPLAEVAFHALDMPQFWPSPAKTNRSLPLVIPGSWSQRRQLYRQILEKNTGRVLFIFAQSAYEADFQKFIEQSKESDRLLTIKDFAGQKRTQKLIGILKKTNKVALIGTLGEVFFPLQAGDTLVIDQPSHVGAKSQLRPFMTAKQIALVRGEIEMLRVVLGDSVISPDDLLAVKIKQFRLVTSSYIKRPLTVIDRLGQSQLFAPSLLEEVENSVKSGDKLLILVMARGWASALVCQACGHVFTCSNCQRTAGVAGQKLRCGYCATEIELPKICPICRASDLKPIGEGVSTVKKYLADHLSKVKIQELSSDQPVLEEKAQIVVATEKIFSFPDIQFDRSFIVSADRLLSGTHLDGAWRLLGYLIELQSRSKQIVAQTYFPNSLVWSAVSTGNVRPFFAEELANRRQLRLPPYGAVISIRGSVSTTEKIFDQAEKITNEILKFLPTADVSYPEVDDHSGNNYHGHFTIYLPKPPQNFLKAKLASLLPPAWHLDIN